MVLPRPLALLVAVVASVLVGLTVLPAAASSGPVPPAPVRTASADDALEVTGRTPDGWARYRLVGEQLPARVPLDAGFRGEVHFVHDGRARAVRLLVPPGVRAPAPLLVALHGLYQNPTTSEAEQRWGSLVRRERVVLAYGVGASSSWNAGTCCGRSVQEGVDDVGYLDRVRTLAGALAPLDPRRLYLTGFSNGAMMAYRYACERPGDVAAVLAVAGTVAADCRGKKDVAVLHVHGVADRMVPLAGLEYSETLRTPLQPVSRAATMFGPTISAKLLPTYGHGWPTRARGGYDTTAAGWAFLRKQRSR